MSKNDAHLQRHGRIRHSERVQFTYLAGYLEYVELLEELLPASQKPRIAPVDLALLMVYEEKFSLWERLLSVDKIHASPVGTFCTAVSCFTLFFKKARMGRCYAVKHVVSVDGRPSIPARYSSTEPISDAE